MKPLLSFIIPFFGNADKELLNRCLHTIHEQNMDKEEYEIIVTDGSNIGEARNQGLSKAKGEYIFFVDADDYIFPNSTDPYIQKLKNEKPDLVSFRFKKVAGASSKSSNHPATQIKWQSYATGAGYMKTHNITGSVWCHLIKRELIANNKICFVEDTLQEDEAFMAKVYVYANTILTTSHKLYAYTYQPNSILHKQEKAYQLKRMGDIHRMLLHLQAYEKENLSLSEIQHHALARRIHFLTIDYLRQLLRNRIPLNYIRKELAALKKENLLPLPNKNYSWKYSLCRLGINIVTV